MRIMLYVKRRVNTRQVLIVLLVIAITAFLSGCFVIEVYENLIEANMPFKLKNISLLGKTIK